LQAGNITGRHSRFNAESTASESHAGTDSENSSSAA
jgi:hypothetical protein